MGGGVEGQGGDEERGGAGMVLTAVVHCSVVWFAAQQRQSKQPLALVTALRCIGRPHLVASVHLLSCPKYESLFDVRQHAHSIHTNKTCSHVAMGTAAVKLETGTCC